MTGKARRYLQDMRGRRSQAHRGTSWQKASSSKTRRVPNSSASSAANDPLRTEKNESSNRIDPHMIRFPPSPWDQKVPGGAAFCVTGDFAIRFLRLYSTRWVRTWPWLARALRPGRWNNSSRRHVPPGRAYPTPCSQIRRYRGQRCSPCRRSRNGPR